jgi:lipopolysaccharide-induced tumor necrosis factor-alpha factor
LPQSTQPTIIVNQPVNQLIHFSDSPVQMQCPQCRAQVVTNVAFKSGTATWLICLGVCIFLPCCDLGCCLIPFCVDAAKDAHHTCPMCNSLVGTKKRI